MNFYHDLAPFYDQMISFNERLEKEIGTFQSLLAKFPAKSVLDAGCGSGFHCLLFSNLGLHVTGIDISEDMLKLARKNTEKYKREVTYIQSDFLDMREIPEAQFDAVYCLGNGFVHLLTEKERYQTLINFKNRLNPQGYLCLQMINNDKFLKEKREILAVKQIGQTTFTRTYEYHQHSITFNVEISLNEKVQKFSTELYPLRQLEIRHSLMDIGFNNIQMYGNLNLKPYDPMLSENLCIFCS